MSQTKAHQPLESIVKGSTTARNQYIAFERGFDSILSDTILRNVSDVCDDLLNTDGGSLINIAGYSEKTLLNKVKTLGSKVSDAIEDFGSVDFNAIDESIDGFTQYMCTTINSTIKTIFELLETLISAPITLIDELIQVIERMVSAISELSNILFNCVLDKVYQIQNFLNNLVPRPGNLETLSNMIDACPQLYCFIVDLFKPMCKGQEFSNTQQLLECVRSSITIPINDFFNEYIIQFIKDAVKQFLDVVETARTYMTKKIRSAIRSYIKLLYDKRPVPREIRWLLVTSDNCDGPDEASIMDYVYALRRLTVCLDTTCSAVNSSLKRDIQELNQKLHLGFSYWKRFGVGYDLFLMIEAGEKRKSLAAGSRKDIAGGVNTSSDNLSSTKSIVESINSSFDYSTPDEINVKHITDRLYADEKRSLINNDIILSNGEREFRDGVEDDLVKIYQNLSQELFIYEDKYEEFSKWDSEYLKDELNDEKKKIVQLLRSVQSPEELNGQQQFLSTNSKRMIAYERFEESEYSPKNNDYKQLADGAPISKNQDESQLDFYARWYSSIER